MTTYSTPPMSASDLLELSAARMTEGAALGRIAADLDAIQLATGRQFVLHEVDGASWWPMGGIGAVEGAMPSQPAPEAAEAPKSDNPATVAAKPEVAPVAPLAEPPSPIGRKPRAPEWASLNLLAQAAVEHLERLPDTFEPGDDMHLIEMLTTGSKLDVIAPFLGIDTASVASRWAAMVKHPQLRAQNGKGASIEGQRALLAAARYRVAEAGHA